MKVTVIKTLNGKQIASAELVVKTLEDLVIFTQKLGYTQTMDEYVTDFRNFHDITYQLGMQHEFQ